MQGPDAQGGVCSGHLPAHGRGTTPASVAMKAGFVVISTHIGCWKCLQDLSMDDQVEQRLKNNPKVRIEGDGYAYQVSRKAGSRE